MNRMTFLALSFTFLILFCCGSILGCGGSSEEPAETTSFGIAGPGETTSPDVEEVRYCAEEPAPADRVGPGPAGAIDYLRSRYPAPPMEEMLIFDPENVVLVRTPDGRNAYVIDFEIHPFVRDYPPGSDTIFEEILMVSTALLVVPARSDLRTDALLFSINKATSNGLPPPEEWNENDPKLHDPMRTLENTPEWFSGTSDNKQYKATYSRIAYDHRVPILFFNVVPDKLVFRAQTEDLLRQWHTEKSPEFLCNDLECEIGVDESGQPARGAWKDGPINHCLSQIAYMDTSRSVLKNYNAGSFYALAVDRAIDATEELMNRISQPETNFDIQKVITIGGSKRGIASRHSLAGLSRVKGALSGHANGGDFLKTMEQRLNLYRFEPAELYQSAADNLSFFQDEQSYFYEWFRLHDPAYWSPGVWDDKKLLITWGTNDTYFHTGAELSYSLPLPSNTDYLAVINYPHGGGTVDHAVSFKQLVREVLDGLATPRLEARWNFTDNTVIAKITGETPDNVELWCTDRMTERNIIPLRTNIDTCQSVGDEFKMPPPDLRYAHWARTSMAEVSPGRYLATPPSASGGPTYDELRACVVRISKGVDDYVLTSKTMLNENLCNETLLQSVTEELAEGCPLCP